MTMGPQSGSLFWRRGGCMGGVMLLAMVLSSPAAILVVAEQYPSPNSVVEGLGQVEVRFSAPVVNVDAFDLLVNNSPATNLVVVDAAQYIFQFPQPPAGLVQVAFGANHQIQSAEGVALESANWTYQLDTNHPPPQPVINEFMAANSRTLRDQDGDYSDWIEIYNPDAAVRSLAGYHLTDDAANLGKWTFPAVAMESRGYLVVFASGKNRAVANRQLHTNFKLGAAGDYLALVAPDGTNILQQFAPRYPAQTNDVSYGLVIPGWLDYMQTPTPGAANVPTRRVQDVEFSVPSGTFLSPFRLALACATAGASIYYTTNGTAPSRASLVYSNPIPINGTAQIRAFADKAGMTPGAVRTAAYLQLEAAAQSFSSDLPIIVIDSFGAGIVQSADRAVYLMTFEPDPRTGRASLTNRPTLAMRGGLHIRGAVSASFPKHQFKLELWDENNQQEDAEILGLPAESDWVLNGDYSDESLVRNPLVYDFGRELGLEAPRSRFAELFLHTSGGLVRGTLTDSGTTSYYGVMSLMEFIKIGKNRVNIDPLGPMDNAEPEITGGYIIRFEKGATEGPVLVGWSTLELDDPKRPTTNQFAWICAYMNSFRKVVGGAGYRDPLTGFRAYIDEASVVNNMILNELTHNQDAYVRSAYLWKARGGKLVEGPLWDYNTSFGLCCCFDAWRTNNWAYMPNPTGDRYWNIPDSDRATTNGAFRLYERLMSDPDFSQSWVDRYQALRQNLLRQEAWNARVDGYAAQIAEAQTRNFARWKTLGVENTGFESGLGNFINIATQTWPILVQQIKDWTKMRLLWMDAQFPAPVVLSASSGVVPAGTALLLTNGTTLPIYYTLDGTDPRAPGGGVAAGATRWRGTNLVLTNSLTVVARSYGKTNSYGVTNWSGPTLAHFYITSEPASAANLIVTEIQYHPAPPTPAEVAVNTNLVAEDFEFLELKNIGSNTVDLFQVRFIDGINFNFTTAPALAPGQYALVVKDRAAFSLRYGTNALVAGAYEGQLNNGGERLTLVDYRDQIIANFSYDNMWSVLTDGLGFSLVAVNENAAPVDPGARENWRASSRGGGTPGQADPPLAVAPVLINEIMTHAVPPEGDAIELFNPNTNAVAIGGWWLTDAPFTPKKYRIPEGTVIGAGAYVVFTETQFNALPGSSNCFGLSANGEQVYLFSADAAGELTGYAHGLAFGAAAPGVTFGRYLTSTGEEQFPAQIAPTLGTNNLGPRVGPVVISEIHYHPAPGDDAFVELKNNGAAPVPLYDMGTPTNTWRLAGVSFHFPPNSALAAGACALVVETEPVEFRAKYGVPAAVQIFGPYEGVLQHGGESLELQWPRPPFANGVDYVTMDVVRYDDQAPWTEAADGSGPSLQRLGPGAYGNDPANWTAASPGPATPFSGGAPPTLALLPASQVAVAGQTVTFTASATGTAPLRFQWRFKEQALPGGTQPQLVLSNVQPEQAGEYRVIVFNGAGSVISPPASLSVELPPRIISGPQSTNVTAGANVILSVVAEGTGSLRYQWRFGGIELANQTNATLRLTNIQARDEGQYTVLVSDDIGSTLSAPATLQILVKPVILEQPQSQTAVQGDTVRFTVRLSGTPPFAFRWRRGSTVIQAFGVGTDTLTLTNVQAADAGNYNVSVTNSAPGGSLVISANAVLTVLADSDGDHVPDVWLAQYFGHTNGLAADLSRAQDDADGDGMLNWQEFRAGTDPRDSNSVLRLAIPRLDGEAAWLGFQGVPGKRYALEALDWLSLSNWAALTNLLIDTSPDAQVPDGSAGKRPSRFYRLRLAP